MRKVTSYGQRRRRKRQFEAAGSVVLGRVLARRPSASSPSLFYRVRGLLLLLLIVVGAATLWLALDDRFYIYHADVVGAVRTSPDEIFHASGLPGLHILWVRPDDVEARILAALPYVKSAQVVCEPSSRCKISVVERQPRVMWEEEGRSWWIDEEGAIFSAQSSGESVVSEGWLVRGPLPRDEYGHLDELVRVALSELWMAEVDISPPLYYVQGRGLVFTDRRGWRVVIGQGAGIEQRLHVLERLVTDLERRGLTPRFVDVRFPDAPYYSLKNDW